MARSVMSAQDRLEPVVAGGVDVVGLGGGEQQLVDAAHEQRDEPALTSRRGTRAEHGFQRALADRRRRRRAAFSAPEHVDEHDLAVETAEVIA